jgi:hypothetical protein
MDGIDPAYGDYLASVIMSMDYGTDVLYHLASNIEEAKKISRMDAARATLALGRLEARFALHDQEKQQKLKVSEAPKPPARLNKGTATVRNIPDDTDDLDLFAKKLYGKK